MIATLTKGNNLNLLRVLNLSNKRSQARKKSKEKFDSVLSDQKGLRVDKDTDKDFNNIFIYIWDSLKVRRGSKKTSFRKV